MTSAVVLEPRSTLGVMSWIRAHSAVWLAKVIMTATRCRPHLLELAIDLIHIGARPASFQIAQRARTDIVSVSLRSASAHGCLLRSIATIVLCRFHGAAATWKLGVASPPPSAHAWVVADGQAIGEPFDPDLLYTLIVSVTPRKGIDGNVRYRATVR